jgi:molecular chaperone DnaJ
MNPYEVLGIAENSDKEQIKEAYLNLARQHHPDRGGDATKFKEATDAYDILSNNKPNPQHTHSHNINPTTFSELFRQGLNPFGDIFSQFARNRTAQPINLNTHDSEIQFNLKANLEQVKKGALSTVSYKRNKVCSVCNGHGGEGKQNCQICHGTGVKTIQHNPLIVQQMRCESCNGHGITFTQPCQSCNTNGFIQTTEQITIKITEYK